VPTDRQTELLEGRLDERHVLVKYLLQLTATVLHISLHCSNTSARRHFSLSTKLQLVAMDNTENNQHYTLDGQPQLCLSRHKYITAAEIYGTESMTSRPLLWMSYAMHLSLFSLVLITGKLPEGYRA